MVTNATEARTALYGTHVRLGAKMAPFGGFIMPIQYDGILDEHKAVRSAVGMFDLSHMGQFVVRGDAAPAWLDSLTVNEVSTMRPNQARYNVFTNPSGGAMDDAIVYRFPDAWLVVVNASNTPKLWAWFNGGAAKPSSVSLVDRTAESALIALQGPRSAELLQPLTNIDLNAVRYYYATHGSVGGADADVARTGYTGEDGFELFVKSAAAEGLWDRLAAKGERVGARPCGLGARDVLRLEAGMPLYGHELDENITPLQAGLDWAVKLGKPDFVGKDALVEQKRRGGYDRIVGLIMDGRAPARAGYTAWSGTERVGEIRSGSPAPALGGKNIATALVREAVSPAGSRIEVEIRGQRHPATVTPMPFYKRAR